MILTELFVILALIVVNGVFAGAEIAIVSLRRTRVQQLVDASRAGARTVAALRAEPERFFATVQVGITVVTTTAAAFGGARIARNLEPLLRPLPVVGGHNAGRRRAGDRGRARSRSCRSCWASWCRSRWPFAAASATRCWSPSRSRCCHDREARSSGC